MTPYVFRYKGRQVKANALNKAWNKLKILANVNPKLNFHDLRRTIAVSLYEVSKDLRIVEQMLGHQSLSSTLRYLEHRDPTKLKPYLDAITTPKTEVIQ